MISDQRLSEIRSQLTPPFGPIPPAQERWYGPWAPEAIADLLAEHDEFTTPLAQVAYEMISPPPRWPSARTKLGDIARFLDEADRRLGIPPTDREMQDDLMQWEKALLALFGQSR